MARRKWTEKLIEEMEAEGLGRGFGAEYIPWIAVQDVSSLGRSRRVWSHKTQREHHLLSDVEYNLFLCLEWAVDVIDIREQYPLSRQLTQAFADSLGIRHPCYPGTKVPTVMTVDFLVTRLRYGEKVHEAFNAKTTEEAEDENSLLKLEIQREVCAQLEYEHHLIFDSQISKQIATNIAWIRNALPKPDEADIRPDDLEELCVRMEGNLGSSYPEQTLQSYCSSFDAKFGLTQGVGLRIARILLHRRILKADMQSVDLAAANLDSFVMTGSQSKLRVF
jgi:hypothetical protein